MSAYKEVLEIVVLFELKRIFNADTGYGCINRWVTDENGKVSEVKWKVEVELDPKMEKQLTMQDVCKRGGSSKDCDVIGCDSGDDGEDI